MNPVSLTGGSSGLAGLLAGARNQGRGLQAELLDPAAARSQSNLSARFQSVSIEIRFEQTSLSVGGSGADAGSSGLGDLAKFIEELRKRLEQLGEQLAQSFAGIAGALGQFGQQLQQSFADLVGGVLDQTGITGIGRGSGDGSGLSFTQTSARLEASFQGIEARLADGNSISARQLALEFQLNFTELNLIGGGANGGGGGERDKSNPFSALDLANRFGIGEFLNSLA